MQVPHKIKFDNFKVCHSYIRGDRKLKTMSGKISRNWKLSGRLLRHTVPARLIELGRKERPGFYSGFCQTFLNFICWTVRQHQRKAEWSGFEFGRKQRQQYVRITAEQAAQEL